jgi:hypothetical protein
MLQRPCLRIGTQCAQTAKHGVESEKESQSDSSTVCNKASSANHRGPIVRGFGGLFQSGAFGNAFHTHTHGDAIRGACVCNVSADEDADSHSHRNADGDSDAASAHFYGDGDANSAYGDAYPDCDRNGHANADRIRSTIRTTL